MVTKTLGTGVVRSDTSFIYSRHVNGQVLVLPSSSDSARSRCRRYRSPVAKSRSSTRIVAIISGVSGMDTDGGEVDTSKHR